MCTWVILIPWSENEWQIFRPLTPEDQNPRDQGEESLEIWGKKREIYRRGQKELNPVLHNFSVYQCKILCDSNREINLIWKLQNSVHPRFGVSAHYFVLRLFLWNSLTTPLQDSTCGMVQFSQGNWLHGQLIITWQHSFQIQWLSALCLVFPHNTEQWLLTSIAVIKTSFVAFGKCLNHLLTLKG